MPILNLFGCDLSLFFFSWGRHYGSLALREEADSVFNFCHLRNHSCKQPLEFIFIVGKQGVEFGWVSRTLLAPEAVRSQAKVLRRGHVPFTALC